MPRLRYFAGPGTEVSFADGQGRPRLVTFDRDGAYETEDEGEIRVLDGLADSVGHPIQHADPDAVKAPKRASMTKRER